MAETAFAIALPFRREAPGLETSARTSPAHGDEAEHLVVESYRQVHASLCRMCGDPELAADLTQETYRRAWTALPSWERRSSFATWVHRIAYTTFLNHVRSRSALVPLDDAGELRTRSDADAELVASDEAARLRRAVFALPEPLRYAVSAHYWGDVPVRELARAEGISTVAVRKRLKKALALVERALQEGRR